MNKNKFTLDVNNPLNNVLLGVPLMYSPEDAFEERELLIDKQVNDLINPIIDRETKIYVPVRFTDGNIIGNKISFSMNFRDNNNTYNVNYLPYFNSGDFKKNKFQYSFFSLEYYNEPNTATGELIFRNYISCLNSALNPNINGDKISVFRDLNYNQNGGAINLSDLDLSKLTKINDTTYNLYLRVRFFYADSDNGGIIKMKKNPQFLDSLNYNQDMEFYKIFVNTDGYFYFDSNLIVNLNYLLYFYSF